MKRFLLLSVLSLICLTISAKTKTWVGSSGGSFNNATNWSPTGIPSSNNDVIIPKGSNVIIDGANIKSITLQGNAVGIMNNNINFTNASSIATNATFNWESGFLGGDGTLTNLGNLNLVSINSKVVSGQTVILNEGIVNYDSTGSLVLGYGNGSLTNSPSGVINLNSDSSISFSQGIGTLFNTGLISRNQGAGLFSIDSRFENNGGTISVESGTLRLNNGNAMLTNGTYNVTSGNTLEWAGGFTLLGTLKGQLDGQINWTGSMTVATGTEAILDFDGPTGVNWSSGGLGGNGTLTNMAILNLVTANGKFIGGETKLNNEKNFNFNGTGGLILGFGSPTLTNTNLGTINLNTDSEFTFTQGIGTVINSGIINKEQSSGTFTFGANTNNLNPGKIICENGRINFGAYIGNGLVGGNGTVEMQNSTTFGGTIAPGSSPGTLNFASNYNAAQAAILAVEIDGSNASTDYDVFAIQGNAVLNGTIDLTLNYAPNVNDEFVILTAPSIATCNLPPTVQAEFNSDVYNFDVICNTNNVTLKLNNIVLVTPENSFSKVELYPNLSKGRFTIDLGREYSEISIEIRNFIGQVISSEKFKNVNKIETAINVRSGIYFANLKSSEGTYKSFKIIKNL